MSDTRRAIEGIKWNYISTIGLMVAQIGFAAALARLLEPAVFGLMAMANMMINLGSQFSGAAIRSYIVQKADLGERAIQATFLLTGVFGLGLTIIVLLLAPVGGLIFRTEEVEPVIRLLSIVYIFTGLSITSSALLQRALRFKILAMINMVAYVSSYLLVALPLALMGGGVWAIAYAMLCQQGILAVAAYCFSRHTIGLKFGWADFKEAFLSGMHYSANAILDFIVTSLPTLLIGRGFGETKLGVYNRADMLVTLPIYNPYMAISRVFLPYIAPLQNTTGRMKRVYLRFVTLTSLVYIPLCLGMIPAARELVLVVLGDKWKEGIPVFQILAIANLFHCAAMFPAQYADALKHLRQKTIVGLLTIALTSVTIIGFMEWGIVGAATGFAAGQLFRFALYMWFLRRWIRPTMYEYLHMFLPGLAIGAAVMFSVGLVHDYLQFTPLILTLILEIMVGGVAYALTALLVPSRQLNDALKSLVRTYEGKQQTWYVNAVLGVIGYRLK